MDKGTENSEICWRA